MAFFVKHSIIASKVSYPLVWLARGRTSITFSSSPSKHI